MLTLTELVALGLDGPLRVSCTVAYGADLAVAPWLAPAWIVAVWLRFGTMLSESLTWLQGRPALAAFPGATSGPPSYLAGARLGPACLPRTTVVAMVVLAVMWAVTLPGLLWIAGRVRLRYDRS